ncbi:DUF6233 domain-containing protein [Streptomyces sp. 7N604]|uniref:DUF6233 domain-containing protein n=1 Tax=Streptomyces sp. 7N604 TaxID=3457415 RepID=UPI003FD435A0
MHELPPDLPRLRVLETYLRLQLAAVEAAIVKAEKRGGRTDVEWWVIWERTRPGVTRRGTIHRRGCWREGEPTLNADQATKALRDPRIAPCDLCMGELLRRGIRPDPA